MQPRLHLRYTRFLRERNMRGRKRGRTRGTVAPTGNSGGNQGRGFSCGAGSGCSHPACTSKRKKCTMEPVPSGAYCCGDGVCTSPAEDSKNCARDCPTPPPTRRPRPAPTRRPPVPRPTRRPTSEVSDCPRNTKKDQCNNEEQCPGCRFSKWSRQCICN